MTLRECRHEKCVRWLSRRRTSFRREYFALEKHTFFGISTHENTLPSRNATHCTRPTPFMHESFLSDHMDHSSFLIPVVHVRVYGAVMSTEQQAHMLSNRRSKKHKST